jgi:hypothetical protein
LRKELVQWVAVRNASSIELHSITNINAGLAYHQLDVIADGIRNKKRPSVTPQAPTAMLFQFMDGKRKGSVDAKRRALKRRNED